MSINSIRMQFHCSAPDNRAQIFLLLSSSVELLSLSGNCINQTMECRVAAAFPGSVPLSVQEAGLLGGWGRWRMETNGYFGWGKTPQSSLWENWSDPLLCRLQQNQVDLSQLRSASPWAAVVDCLHSHICLLCAENVMPTRVGKLTAWCPVPCKSTGHVCAARWRGDCSVGGHARVSLHLTSTGHSDDVAMPKHGLGSTLSTQGARQACTLVVNLCCHNNRRKLKLIITVLTTLAEI